MNKFERFGVVVCAAVTAFSLFGGTARTWVGSSAGGDGTTFATAKNWNPEGAPASGDTLTFGSAATLSDGLVLGADGITIVCNADVTVNGVISGAGKLTKDGSKLLALKAVNTHTGGTLLLNGECRTTSATKMGTGQIEIRRASGKKPILSGYQGVITNAILITGAYVSGGHELDLCQEVTFSGPITCAADFEAWDHYQNGYGSTLSGRVSAPGHTLYLRGSGSIANGKFHVNGRYDCSYSKDATANTTFYKGVFTDRDATFAVWGGTNVFESGAIVTCTNIVVDNAGAKNTVLEFDTASVLGPGCELKVQNNAKIYVPSNIVVPVPKLTVNGTAVPAGDYTASSAAVSGVLFGAGTLRVGATIDFSTKTWKGGSGLFNEPTNWTPALVPASGDTLVFNSASTLTDDFSIGAEGMTFVCNAAVTANGVISGAGKLTKDGSGLFAIAKANTFSGGLLVLNGGYKDNNVGGGFGTGPIEIRRSTGKNPHLEIYRRVRPENITITGPCQLSGSSYYQLDLCQETTLSGTISCDADFIAWDHYQNDSGSALSGTVNAHGHTMYLLGGGIKNSGIHLNGTFDCSLNKNATFGPTYLNGSFTDVDATYAIYGGTNTVKTGSSLVCTNVVVDNAGAKSATLRVETATALNPNATLKLSNGGKLYIPSSITVTVCHLEVNGAAIAAGSYDASSAALGGALAGVGSLVVTGKLTRKWVGGASGAWSTAANWSPAGAPTAGEIARITSAATFTAETITIGSGELTINAAADIVCNATFTGAGKLVKTGADKVTFGTKNTYTGGTRIEDGEIYTGNGKAVPGPYEIVRATGKSPLLHGHTQNYAQKITVSGVDTTQRTITLDNNSSITGGLDADGDVTIYNGYSYNSSGSSISGGISAHGHKIYFTNAGNNAYSLYGIFDASIEFAATKAQINMNAQLTDPDATYTIKGGTNIIGSAASLACKEVIVDNAANKVATLRMNAQGFRSGTALKLVSGGKVLIPSGVIVVSAFYVDGVQKADGVYTAANLSASVAGSGSLIVGGTANAWVGGGTATWDDPDCWSLGRVPASGETVYFSGTVSVAAGENAVDIGAAGIVICNDAQVSIRTIFTGSGSLTKQGAGELWLHGTNSFTGGAILTDGSTALYSSSALGTGTVEVRRANGKVGTLYPQNGCAMTNRIEVTGSYTPGETTVYLGNNGSIYGPIEATDDIMIVNGYTPGGSLGSRIQGGISAPGHVVHFGGPGSYWVTTVVAGTIDASVETAGKVSLRNFASMTDPAATYVVNGGSNYVYETAGTAITNWTVNGAAYDTCLNLADGPALPKESTLTLTNGGKLGIPAGVCQRVAAFTAGGTVYSTGRYTAANLPTYLTGAGVLKVGGGGFIVIVKGPSDGPAPEPDPVKLFFAGDSTLDYHNGDESVYGSWGWNLRGSLKDGNAIDDRARSGYSTPTFRSDGLWGKLLDSVSTNDYVYMAFGHNDMSTSTADPSRIRFQATISEYQGYLRQMVDEVRAKGGIPVIGTPIARNTWSNGELKDWTNGRGESLRDYGLAAIAVAQEKGCDYVDMNLVTSTELTMVGHPYCQLLFVNNDGSHPCPLGARRFAALFLREVRRRQLPIAKLFR